MFLKLLLSRYAWRDTLTNRSSFGLLVLPNVLIEGDLYAALSAEFVNNFFLFLFLNFVSIFFQRFTTGFYRVRIILMDSFGWATMKMTTTVKYHSKLLYYQR